MSDNARWHQVAALSDLADPGSRGFQVETDGMPVFGFVVRKDGKLYGYENVCPHAGRMLNWGPHRFLTQDQSMIMCVAHGALFDITSGECATGPCMGESLRQVPVREVDGVVEADISPLAML